MEKARKKLRKGLEYVGLKKTSKRINILEILQKKESGFILIIINKIYKIVEKQSILRLMYFLPFSEAKAVIQGPDEKYIKAGSSLKLICRFENVTQQPETVFW